MHICNTCLCRSSELLSEAEGQSISSSKESRKKSAKTSKKKIVAAMLTEAQLAGVDDDRPSFVPAAGQKETPVWASR